MVYVCMFFVVIVSVSVSVIAVFARNKLLHVYMQREIYTFVCLFVSIVNIAAVYAFLKDKILIINSSSSLSSSLSPSVSSFLC